MLWTANQRVTCSWWIIMFFLNISLPIDWAWKTYKHVMKWPFLKPFTFLSRPLTFRFYLQKNERNMFMSFCFVHSFTDHICSLFLPFNLPVCLCLRISLGLCLAGCVCLSVSPSLSHSLFLCLPLSLCFCLFLSVSLCLSVSVFLTGVKNQLLTDLLFLSFSTPSLCPDMPYVNMVLNVHRNRTGTGRGGGGG